MKHTVAAHASERRGAAPPAATASSHELFDAIVDRWRDGEPPDTDAALARHPEIAGQKSLLLDLLFEEFCLRVEAGQSPSVGEYCRRYPAYQASLRKQFLVHGVADELVRQQEREPPVCWPHEGDVFAGFLLLRELGRGAFGRVFLAGEVGLSQRRVVVKISRQGEDEARTLAQLRHPGIVPIHSCRREEATGLTVVCMPYVGTATLEDVIWSLGRAGRLPRRAAPILDAVRGRAIPDEPVDDYEPAAAALRRGDYVTGVLHLGLRLLEALDGVHRRGIWHRDLKPSNVLLSPSGRPMLLDFNLSADPTQAGRPLGGTLPYMAPEQVKAMAAPEPSAVGVDARADLFSFAVLLYQLLAGTHPFGPFPEDEEPRAALERWLGLLRAGPAPLREKNRLVDRRLAAAIHRCLEFDPAQRPQTATEFAEALRPAFSFRARSRRWLALHAGATAAAGLAGVVLISAGAFVATAVRGPGPLEQGQRLLRQQRPQEALPFLRQAVRDEQGNRRTEAVFALGRAHQLAGDLPLALSLFEDVRPALKDGRVEACMAYCYARRKVHDRAVILCRQALSQRFSSAELYNNLGYSYLQSGQLKEARASLDEALRRKPGLGAAYHNRLRVTLNELLSLPVSAQKAEPNKRRRLLEAGRADMLTALELSPHSAEVHVSAANLLLVTDPEDSGNQRLAIEHLRKAHDRGQDLKGLGSPFRELIAASSLGGLPETPQRPEGSSTCGLVDPLADP
jgi:eukaryotic-like serine/threonine-protein kinase